MNGSTSIRAALERAARTVTLRPERGQRTYTNIARVQHGTCCTISEGNDRMVIDVPQALGGAGAGPSPSTVLRAAFTSCIAIGIKQSAARESVEVDAIEVRLETDVDARGQLGLADEITPGFLGIRLQIDVRTPADPSKLDDIIAKSLRYSPLLEVFANPQSVTHQIRVAPPSNHRIGGRNGS
ncbi:MAG: OsmC family protein [Pseudomonadota bacterium]